MREMASRSIRTTLALLAGAAALVPPSPLASASADEPLAIIVNRSNPVEGISFDELRDVFLAGRSHWPNGRRITVVMLDPGQPEREAVLRVVYRMKESDFTRYFLHATFTGEALAAPRRLSTSAGVRRFVFNAPGAIGYVRADEVDDSVKVVRVDGRAPGDPDYRIRMPLP